MNVFIRSNLRKVAMSLVQNLDGNFDLVSLSVLSKLDPLALEDLSKCSSTQTLGLKQIYDVTKMYSLNLLPVWFMFTFLAQALGLHV